MSDAAPQGSNTELEVVGAVRIGATQVGPVDFVTHAQLAALVALLTAIPTQREQP